MRNANGIKKGIKSWSTASLIDRENKVSENSSFSRIHGKRARKYKTKW